MPERTKKKSIINARGDLPAYSNKVSAFLDGQEKMLYGYEEERARALLLYCRLMEDREGAQLPEGAQALDDLVGFARQLDASAMIRREDFDTAAMLLMRQADVTDDEAAAFLGSISDRALQRAAVEFDIGPGGLNVSEHLVRPDNALRAIRSCMPSSGSMSTMSLPRAVAGIMGAICLAELGSGGATFTFPACENGDAVLGLFDAMQADKDIEAASMQASFYNEIGSTLAKMSLAAAGYDTSTLQASVDRPGQEAVPTRFTHASNGCVIASYEPFNILEREYLKEHRDDERPRHGDAGPFTDPFPHETGWTLPLEESFVRYCTSLLAEGGVAALWMPAASARGPAARMAGKPLLEENLLHAVVEFRQLSETNGRIARPMTIWVIKRGRKENDPVLLALLDGDGFNEYCGGISNQLAPRSDMPLSDNAAAQKAVELVTRREAVDKCALLVSPKDLLAADTPSLRFIDYASPIDLAKALAKPQNWEEMIANYKESIAQNASDEFLAALDEFHRLVGGQEGSS